MRKTTWEEADEDAHREQAPVTKLADQHAELWQRQGVFDWYATFSFDERTHKARWLKKPENVHRFVIGELRRFGYFGPYVVVAHDNSGTRYYHAHVLLSDYKPGLCAGLSEKFTRHGNVSKTDDGPIRGTGAFWYCANRAFGREYSEPMTAESFSWSRRPRKRGRGRGKGVRPTPAPSALQRVEAVA